jgi:hypothetical protein
VKVSGTLGLGQVAEAAALMPTTTERQAMPIADTSSHQIDDPLTLSSAARSRAEAAAHPRFGALSVAAHQNPDLADQLAYDCGHILQTPLYDLATTRRVLCGTRLQASP